MLVTEPTRAAFHDLKRVVRLCQKMNLNASLCVNRMDINTMIAHEEKEWCKNEGILTIGEIPEDSELYRIQMLGKIPGEPEHDSKSVKAVREMWEILKSI